MTKANNDYRANIFITPGDPSGIGPDLCVLMAQQNFDANLVLIADPGLIKDRAKLLKLDIDLQPFDVDIINIPEQLQIIPCPLNTTIEAGIANPASASYTLECLDIAIEHCLKYNHSALVTGPLNKALINEAGIKFSGHTEYLAQQTHTFQTVMMLKNDTVSVVLATTHIPLSAVASAITADLLERIITITDQEMRFKFGLASPRLAVLGLNPHAGEDGHIGLEEQQIMIPLLNKLRQQGMHIEGPMPADTAFNKSKLNDFDVYIAMYHDQGLPIVKHTGFGNTVNITLGLPIIRTSVDHGTAYDLAGKNSCDNGSMICAIESALSLIKQKNRS